MAKRLTLTEEEKRDRIRKQQRIRNKRRYEKIKSDPEAYKAFREKAKAQLRKWRKSKQSAMSKIKESEYQRKYHERYSKVRADIVYEWWKWYELDKEDTKDPFDLLTEDKG